MDTTKLRAKWQKSISKVDEEFLVLVDQLYDSYENNKSDDFFDSLPSKVRELLVLSTKQSEDQQIISHEQVVKELRGKYNAKK